MKRVAVLATLMLLACTGPKAPPEARCLKEYVTEAELLPHADVTEIRSLPHDGCYPNHGGMDMVAEISTATRTEVLEAIPRPVQGGVEERQDQDVG